MPSNAFKPGSPTLARPKVCKASPIVITPAPPPVEPPWKDCEVRGEGYWDEMMEYGFGNVVCEWDVSLEAFTGYYTDPFTGEAWFLITPDLDAGTVTFYVKFTNLTPSTAIAVERDIPVPDWDTFTWSGDVDDSETPEGDYTGQITPTYL